MLMENVESAEVIFVFYIMKRYYNYLQKIFAQKLVKAQKTDKKNDVEFSDEAEQEPFRTRIHTYIRMFTRTAKIVQYLKA
jgi:hypothetical protein